MRRRGDGVYKFKLDKPLVAFRAQIEDGEKFNTPSGKIEILSTTLAKVTDWTRTQYGYEIPYIPKWVEPFESLNSPKIKEYRFHLVSPHPRWRTHSIFHNIGWLRETYQQELTLNASDAQKLGVKMGDIVEVWNERGKVVVPAYVTERCMPNVVVLYEGAWMDMAKDIYKLIVQCNSLKKDLLVYLMGHVTIYTSIDDRESKCLVTNGRKLEKIKLESKLPIVLFTSVNQQAEGSNKFFFETQKNRSTGKTPPGMFSSFLIPNSLTLVDRKIREYYGI